MWVWVNSGSLWWTGRPGVLWFMGSQRVGHDWATELNWTECPQREIGQTCEERLPWVSLAGWIWGAYKWRGGIFTGEGGVEGRLPWFLSPLQFPKGEGCPFLAQIRTVMATWWVLICKPNFMEHNDHQVTLRCRRILPFPTFLCLSPRILSLKMCGFLSVWKFLLSFVCLWTSAVYKMCDFQPPGPCLYLLLCLL